MLVLYLLFMRVPPYVSGQDFAAIRVILFAAYVTVPHSDMGAACLFVLRGVFFLSRYPVCIISPGYILFLSVIGLTLSAFRAWRW